MQDTAPRFAAQAFRRVVVPFARNVASDDDLSSHEYCIIRLSIMEKIASNTLPIERLIKRINRKSWWHCLTRDPEAWRQRGVFYEWSYKAAEFYGRPMEYRVRAERPLVGDYLTICNVLLDLADEQAGTLRGRISRSGSESIAEIFLLDALMHDRALELGYDSIVVMTVPGYRRYCAGHVPYVMELNVLGVSYAEAKRVVRGEYDSDAHLGLARNA